MTHQQLVEKLLKTLNEQATADDEMYQDGDSRAVKEDSNTLRRCYDALNILSALRFIARSSDEKRYYWVGPYFKASAGISPSLSASSLRYPEPGEVKAEFMALQTPAPRGRTAHAREDSDSDEYPPATVIRALSSQHTEEMRQNIKELRSEIDHLRLRAEQNVQLVKSLRLLQKCNRQKLSASVPLPDPLDITASILPRHDAMGQLSAKDEEDSSPTARLEAPFLLLAVRAEAEVNIHRMKADGTQWSVVVPRGRMHLFTDRDVILESGKLAE